LLARFTVTAGFRYCCSNCGSLHATR
jgi:hypothetical protein